MCKNVDLVSNSKPFIPTARVVPMDLHFNTTAITQVGSTAKRSMVVLPSAKHKQQKVAIGDDAGVVTCLTAKKGVYEVPKQYRGRRRRRS